LAFGLKPPASKIFKVRRYLDFFLRARVGRVAFFTIKRRSGKTFGRS
jgi:hypothetical protein